MGTPARGWSGFRFCPGQVVRFLAFDAAGAAGRFGVGGDFVGDAGLVSGKHDTQAVGNTSMP